MTPQVTDEEIAAAALQYVRKVSGFRAPAAHNQAAFDQAVAAVTAATRELLDAPVVRGAPGRPPVSPAGCPGPADSRARVRRAARTIRSPSGEREGRPRC